MRIANHQLKIEKRYSLTGWRAAFISILAIVIGLVLFSIIFIQAEINPLEAYQKIFTYAFANPFGLPLTLNRFIFLLLCTYAFIIPYRAGLWNIGVAGQLYAGALSVFAVVVAFGGKEFSSNLLRDYSSRLCWLEQSWAEQCWALSWFLERQVQR